MYRLDGRRAPRALAGDATFVGGRLRSVAVTAGGRTKLGVAPGRTTVSAMMAVYRRAGFRANRYYEPVFEATFVDVSRAGRRIGAMASGPIVEILAVPGVETCE